MRNTNQLHKLQNLLVYLFFCIVLIMYQHCFRDLFSNFNRWIQGSHRILKDHGKNSSTKLLHILFPVTGDILSVNADTSLFDLGTWRQKLHDTFAKYTLSASGFSNYSQHFSLF